MALASYRVWWVWKAWPPSSKDWPDESDFQRLPPTTPVFLVSRAEFSRLAKTQGRLSAELRQAQVFLVSDGRRVLAVDTQGYDYPRYKSFLEPEAERDVLARVKGKLSDVWSVSEFAGHRTSRHLMETFWFPREDAESKRKERVFVGAEIFAAMLSVLGDVDYYLQYLPEDGVTRLLYRDLDGVYQVVAQDWFC